jgi:hypothetical protein
MSPGASNLSGLRDSKDLHVVEVGKKPEVVFGLSYTALAWIIAGIVGAVIVIVLVAVAIGRFSGSGDTSKKSTSPTETSKTEPGAKTDKTEKAPASPFPAGTYYTVQVLAVKNDPARMKELDGAEAFLKKNLKASDPVVRRANASNTMVSIFAGAFTKEQKSEAEAMAKRISMLMYNNRYDFKGANVVAPFK